MSEDRAISDEIMKTLRQQARDNDSGTRLRTLARLEEACNDIASGRALEFAREHGWDIAYFLPHRRLVPNTVDQYRKMRKFADPKSDWTGPTKDTIAHDEGLKGYVTARDAERLQARRPPRRATKSRKVDEIIAQKLDFNELELVRTALEQGRQAKLKFDTLAAFFHRLSAVDLRQYDTFSYEDVARSIRGQISGDDREALSHLAKRLQDNELLAEMGLVFRNGRVKMGFSPGTDLVKPSELSVLVRLAGLDPDSLVSVN
ncbi:hypothetical protein [Agrobacterium tumefaciens]|uniref:hypothetical protein n=1 Tax=Agrobacterium tumefaciens TaxID=358 RepID=UPI002B003B78|nr:hypothetical protein [Agrobacterium tumefaciens]MEA1842955.1 hypothetical protein [Agrobacterium tumefaciens]